MRLLLDTHIALWAIDDDPRLPPRARALIADPANSITVSVASLWEIAIKHPLKRGGVRDISISAAEAESYFREAGYLILDIVPQHAVAVEGLPDHHADPFDRILLAQSLTEPLRLLTGDAKLAAYSDTVILV